MPADERATLTKRDVAQGIAERHGDYEWGYTTKGAEACRRQLADAIEQALKEADRLAREDAARIVESSLFGCVWGSDLLPLQKRYAAAIRASITTDEG